MVSSLKIELLLIYFVAPLFIFYFDYHKIIFLMLYLVFLITFLILYRDKTFSFSHLKKKDRLGV